jgi:hypothetical protein
MKASADNASPVERRDEGWDESVLVWNAKVTRIPPPAVRQDQAGSANGDVATISPGGAHDVGAARQTRRPA